MRWKAGGDRPGSQAPMTSGVGNVEQSVPTIRPLRCWLSCLAGFASPGTFVLLKWPSREAVNSDNRRKTRNVCKQTEATSSDHGCGHTSHSLANPGLKNSSSFSSSLRTQCKWAATEQMKQLAGDRACLARLHQRGLEIAVPHRFRIQSAWTSISISQSVCRTAGDRLPRDPGWLCIVSAGEKGVSGGLHRGAAGARQPRQVQAGNCGHTSAAFGRNRALLACKKLIPDRL